MIPRTYIHGCGGGERWFWPMGLGGPPPRAMALPAAPTWHLDLRWDGPLLVCAREWNDAQPEPVVTQRDYVWDGDEIAEIVTRLDYGDGTEPDEQGRDVWCWDGGRPREVRYVSGVGAGAGPVQTWTWDDAGERARVTCNAGGTRMAQTAVYDSDGRLIRLERERTMPGRVEAGLAADVELELVVEVDWAPGGRIVAARARPAGGAREHVEFVWDARGRLVEQIGSRGAPVAAIYLHAGDG